MSGRILHVTRRGGSVMGRFLVYFLIWAGLVLLIAAAGIRFFWGKISVNQMLLNLVSVETDGGGGTLVWLGIIGIGILPLLITLALARWQHHRRSKHRRSGLRPRAKWALRTVSTVLVSAVVVGGTTAFATTVGVGDYLKSANSAYQVDDYYTEPAVTADGTKHNLVLIYLESGENTLANDQLFEKDAFAPLKEATPAEEGWRSVENFQQYNGGGWTMSGLVSTQCGIPLKGSGLTAGSSATNELGEDTDTYLAGTTCLGDVLKDQGYTNVFLGGANSSFAAKDTFLKTHGYSEVKGLKDWRSAGEPEESFRKDWGLSDERLLANAREELDRLHAASEQTGTPFNLSMLTLDTHEPVHVYDYCDVDTENEVTSVFACSMTQVAGFVDYMEQMGYLEDTAVVIMGDHLKHMSAGDAFHEQLDHHGNRTIFNRIRVPGAEAPGAVRPGVDQMNMYPTILEAVGLAPANGEAGLGVSVFTPSIPADSAQALEPEAYSELLDSLSPRFCSDAWSN